MSESITVGAIFYDDLSVGYGTTAGVTVIDGTTQTLTKINYSQLNAAYTVTYSATPVFNLQNGQLQTITLTGNVTSSTITNGATTVPTGSRLVLRIIQDGTGSRTFGYPANVLGSGSFPIAATASSTTRVDLEFNGTSWEFVSIPMVVSSGVILGTVVTGSGTAAAVPKFISASVIGSSDLTDNGSGLLTYKYNSAGDTKGWVANETNGAASRALFTVGGNPTTPDNIDISFIVQKSANTTSSWNLTGAIRTGSGATNGMVLSTSAGPIKFQPAGTTTVGAFFLSTTGSSTKYNFEIGTTSATGADSNPLYVRRDQVGSSDCSIINNTTSTTSRAAFRAIADGPDAYFAVTSTTYTLAGGVPSSTAFIYTGASTTGGLIVQTTAGNLNFQIAGTTTIATMTVREMQITGRYRAMTLTRVTPTSGTSCDMFCDGSPGVIAVAAWGASEALSIMHVMNYAGSQHAFYTGANYAALAAKVTIIDGIQAGAPTGGDKGTGTINAASGYYANGTAGISTTVTTASLVGKTITFVNGLCTSFS